MFRGKKIVVTIEARMTSSRLPGKVLLPFCGRPSLQHIVERMRKCTYADDVVVATTINQEDDAVVDLCKKLKCSYYRGSENDVLLRVLQAAQSVNADIIVEITADCPVIDWRHANYLIEKYFDSGSDYASNTIIRSFPDGFDTQVFGVKTLEEVNRLTQDATDHEHVSLYIYRHPERYKLFNWKAPESLNHPEYEITLDTLEDYKLITQIYNALYPVNPDFGCEAVVEYINGHREILDYITNVQRVKV